MWFPLSPRRRRPGWKNSRSGGMLWTAVQPVDDLFNSLQQPLALFDSSPLTRTLCFDCIEGVSCTRHSGGENEGQKEEGVCESLDTSDLSLFKPTFASASDSWFDFYSGMQEGDCNGIEEVFIDVLTPKTSVARPAVKHDGPRRRYERFREKRFTCDYCDRSFTLKQNVQHIWNYHIGDKQLKFKRGRRFKCKKCDQMFMSMLAATRHEQKAHKGLKVKLFRCDDCGRFYPNNGQLKEHISIEHLKERPFKCELCDATFGRRSGVRRHTVMVHTDLTHKCPFEGCDHPGYKCTKALAAHIRSVHTNVRPYVCDVCDKAFVRRNDLNMHQAIHEEVLDFFCPKCQQGFKRQVYLKRHQKTCLPCFKPSSRRR